MNDSNITYIAVDIAKDSLQVQCNQHSFKLDYTTEGLSNLFQCLKNYDRPIVVCEATGGYERKLIQYLCEHQISVSLLNPAEVRAFARSQGIKAKTDTIDAKIILAFAQQRPPRIYQPNSAQQQKLVDLMDRRTQLTDMLTEEKNRLKKAAKSIVASIEKIIASLEKELNSIEEELRNLVDSDCTMQRQAKLMQSVVGVGEATSWCILAYFREITTIGRNQAVALVGLAPFNSDSGNYTGKRFIRAGRDKLRKCLYMAAQSAARFNPVIKPYVESLGA